jgi:hypothetical protein
MESNDDYIRSGFLTSYFDAMKDKARTDGWRAVIPVWFVFGLTIGAAVAYAMPDELWHKEKWDILLVLYATMVTINGLLLALSWSAFSRIHEVVISSPGFSLFLRRAQLLNHYIFYIDYVQAAQLLALLASGVGLFTSLMPLPTYLNRIALAASVGLSIYAIKYAVNAVTVMHDLVWQKAIFEEQDADAASKIVKIPARQTMEKSPDGG